MTIDNNVVFVSPNTRQEGWREALLGREGTFLLVEPDSIVENAIDIARRRFLLIDPQHIGIYAGRNSAVERACEDLPNGLSATAFAYRVGKLEGIDPLPLVVVLPFKVDIDFLGAVAILLGGTALPERVQLIQDVDSGAVIQSKEYDPGLADDNILLLSEDRISDTKLLAKMAQDFKTPPAKRIELMQRWLAGGEAPQEYAHALLQERKKLLEATVELIEGVKVIRCQSAGASSLIYKTTSHCGEGRPFGIAYTDDFQGKGARKISVMQTAAGYVSLEAFFAFMNSEYPEPELGTWGGGKNSQGICCAGGSPVGTKVSPEDAARALAQFVLTLTSNYPDPELSIL
jgi:hypothetical protein